METIIVDTKVGGGKMVGEDGVTNGEGRTIEHGTVMEEGDGSGNHKVAARWAAGNPTHIKAGMGTIRMGRVWDQHRVGAKGGGGAILFRSPLRQ